jgi:hypothetical protein
MADNFNLFFTLIKLKFYLVSLLDSPSDKKSFYFSEEFLERRYPEQKNDILTTLKRSGINSDSEIAFDDSVVIKFRDIVKEKVQQKDLTTILKKLEIDSRELQKKTEEENRSEREQHAHKILDVLFQLSSNWVMHKELENKFEDYSILDEEEVIRPDEEEKLDVLNSNTSTSFKFITELTKTYITLLADYYFKYGGDIQLKEFWKDLDDIKNEIQEKYKELFRSFGLDKELE